MKIVKFSKSVTTNKKDRRGRRTTALKETTKMSRKREREKRDNVKELKEQGEALMVNGF